MQHVRVELTRKEGEKAGREEGWEIEMKKGRKEGRNCFLEIFLIKTLLWPCN